MVRGDGLLKRMSHAENACEDVANCSVKGHKANSVLRSVAQEPPQPEDPAEELTEPNYFTGPKLMQQELRAMEELNTAVAQRVQVGSAPAAF